MSTLLFSNNASSTLAGPISNSTTTINLAAGGGALFPNPVADQYFKLTLTDAATGLLQEIVHVTARSGDQLTVVRGQEGTTPRNWSAGDLAENLITAGTMNAFLQGSGVGGNAFFAGQDTSAGANDVTVPSTNPANTAPANGQLFLITKNIQNNTGAVTMSVGGSAFKNVVYKDGSALVNNDWPGGAAALLYYTGSVYQFLACQGNVPANSLVHYGSDSGSANAIVAAVSPPVVAYSAGQIFNIKAAAPNTGPTTANLGGGALAVVDIFNQPLVGGEYATDSQLVLAYNAVMNKFQLIGVRAGAGALQVFTSSGTYTPTPGIKRALVIVTGAGAGGGGAAEGQAAAGGGAGATAISVVNLAGVSSVAVTIGAPGTGGINYTPPAVAGGQSSFGAYAIAGGGQPPTSPGGGYYNQIGGNGGVASAGDIRIPGGDGHTTTPVAYYIAGSSGGSSFWGGGGSGSSIQNGGYLLNPNGRPGAAYGSGGGGGSCGIGGGHANGGDGKQGVVMVLEL